MDYDQLIRQPGDQISSGADMFRIFGYTDVCNPYIGFDLMNDSNFEHLKNCIEENSPIPDRYNANIIRLRDYRLGGIMNDFRSLCESDLHQYEDAWKEYRQEYNPSMPEEFYQFWMLYDTVMLDTIFPKFVNLIDPVSMMWIDPEYPKVQLNQGVYEFQTDTPIMTSDPKFLHPETKMDYGSYKATDNPLLPIWEEIEQEVQEYYPTWLIRIEYLHNELTNTEPKENETQAEFIRRTKREVRTAIRDAS